ncbi:MAG: HU family DNA-binding protein [Verrucomicrobiota bacterium]|nr:HU family DNA-binding protein [Verrucomicrobiota bacterium]
MTRLDMATRIADTTDFNVHEVNDVLSEFFDSIISELAAGRDVQFRRFGTFKLVAKKSRIGRNPKKPKETFLIPEHVSIKFKPSAKMCENVKKVSPNEINN